MIDAPAGSFRYMHVIFCPLRAQVITHPGPYGVGGDEYCGYFRRVVAVWCFFRGVQDTEHHLHGTSLDVAHQPLGIYRDA